MIDVENKIACLGQHENKKFSQRRNQLNIKNKNEFLV